MVFTIKSLCCINLPQAGVTVGCLTIIGSLWNIMYLLGALIAFDDTTGIQINFYGSTEVILCQIVVYAVIALVGLILIIGTNKNQHQLLLPWLVIGAIVLIYGIGWTLYFLVFGFGKWKSDLGLVLVSYGLAWVFFTGLAIYIWIAIFSLYINIRDEQQKQKNEVAAEKLNPHPYSNSDNY